MIVSVARQPFNPLMATLKPQSNEPLCSNTVVGILAVEGGLLHLVQRGEPGRTAANQHAMWHYNYLCTLKG